MKSFLSFIISCVPLNVLRIFLYRVFLKYDIDYKSNIGMFNIIKCANISMSSAQIGNLNQIVVESLIMHKNAIIKKQNRIKNLNHLELNSFAEIRSGNFIGGPEKGKFEEIFQFDKQNLVIGTRSSILRKNYFDVVDEIYIGENVVFGGNGSEIWTHGFDVKRNMLVGPVQFGNDIFIGSNCIFTKNIKVVSETIIGPASVIYKSIEQPGTYSTQQIKKIK